MEVQKVIIEKFTRPRYLRHLKKDEKFRVFDDRGREWLIKQFDCGADDKQILATSTHYNKYQDKMETDSRFYDEKGKGYWREQLYIVQGVEGIEDGDIIISKSAEDASFFFYQLFKGFSGCDKSYGFCTHWECDCLGGQVSLSHLFNDCTGILRHEYWIRKAEPDEVDNFYKLLLDAGYGHDEEESCLYDVPVVGKEYWTVEPDADGLMQVVHHEGANSEYERTFGKRNVFTYQKKADERAEKINEVMIHGKLE